MTNAAWFTVVRSGLNRDDWLAYAFTILHIYTLHISCFEDTRINHLQLANLLKCMLCVVVGGVGRRSFGCSLKHRTYR